MAKNKIVEEQIMGKQETEVVEEKTVVETVIPTIEEQIMGAAPEVKKVKVVKYDDRTKRYKVKNTLKNRTYEINGYEIGAILGLDTKARDELKHGAKKTAIKKFEKDKEITLYEIEVIK
jgi:hypothetical protein